MNFNKAIGAILAFSGVIAIVVAVLAHFNALGAYPSFTWTCLVFFVVQTLIVLGLASLSNNMTNAASGTNVILGAMMMKFILSLMMIVCYVLIVHPESITFIIPFFIFYMLYTFIETYYLIKMTAVPPKNSAVTAEVK